MHMDAVKVGWLILHKGGELSNAIGWTAAQAGAQIWHWRGRRRGLSFVVVAHNPNNVSWYGPRHRAGSGDLLPPSPPAEKATTSKDQAGQASTDVGNGHKARIKGGGDQVPLPIAIVRPSLAEVSLAPRKRRRGRRRPRTRRGRAQSPGPTR